MKRALGLGAVLLIVAALGGYWRWSRVTPPVTEAEARAYLGRIVDAAQARDFDALCQLNGALLNCRTQLAQVGEQTVPTTPPTVVGTRYLREKGDLIAGRVLLLEGKDGCGRAYRSEVLVFRENRYHFKATNAVYWANYRILDEPGTQTPPPPSESHEGCPDPPQ